MAKCVEYRLDDQCSQRWICPIRRKYGGVLVFIHPQVFSVAKPNLTYGIEKIAEIMNIMRFIDKSNLLLLDYGIEELMGARYPFNQKLWNQLYHEYFAELFNSKILKRSIELGQCLLDLKESELYQLLLVYIQQHYSEREVYVISTSPLTPDLLKFASDQSLFNLIPFATDAKYCQLLRKFEQEKHGELPLNNLIEKNKTFCPVANYILECGLERAVGVDHADFTSGNLFGYLNNYGLLVQYMVTNIGVFEKNVDVEIYSEDGDEVTLPVYVREYKYHGFQVSPKKHKKLIWNKYNNMQMLKCDFPQNEYDFYDQQVAMFQDFSPEVLANNSKEIIQKVCATFEVK